MTNRNCTIRPKHVRNFEEYLLFLVEFSFFMLLEKTYDFTWEPIRLIIFIPLWYPNKQGNLQSFLFVFIIPFPSLILWWDCVLFVHPSHLSVSHEFRFLSKFLFLQRISIHSMHSYENVLRTFDRSITLSVSVCSTCE